MRDLPSDDAVAYINAPCLVLISHPEQLVHDVIYVWFVRLIELESFPGLLITMEVVTEYLDACRERSEVLADVHKQ